MEPPRLTGFRRPAFPYDLEANSGVGPGTLTLSVAQEKLHELTQHIHHQQQHLLRTVPSSVVSFGLDTASGHRSQRIPSTYFPSALPPGVPLSGVLAPMSTAHHAATNANPNPSNMSSANANATPTALIAGDPGLDCSSPPNTSPLATTSENPPTTTTITMSNSNTVTVQGTLPTTTHTNTNTTHDNTTATGRCPTSTLLGRNSRSDSPMSSLVLAAQLENPIDAAMAQAVLIKERLLKIQSAIAFRESNPYVAPSSPPQALLLHAEEMLTGGLFGPVTPTASTSGGTAIYNPTSAHNHSYSSPSSMSMSGNTNAPRRPPSLDGTKSYTSESGTILSPFERIRIAKLLGQLVLDIASLSHRIQDGVFPQSPSSRARSGGGGGGARRRQQHRQQPADGQGDRERHNQRKGHLRRSARKNKLRHHDHAEELQEMLQMFVQRQQQRRPSSQASSDSQPMLSAHAHKRRSTQKPSQLRGLTDAATSREGDGDNGAAAADGRGEGAAGASHSSDLAAASPQPAESVSAGGSHAGKPALTPPTAPRPSSLTQSASASGGSQGAATQSASHLAANSSLSATSSSRRGGGMSGDREGKSSSTAGLAMLYSPSHDSTSGLQTSARESNFETHPVCRTDALALSVSHHRSSTGAAGAVAAAAPAASRGGDGDATTAGAYSPASAMLASSAPARMQSVEHLLSPATPPAARHGINDVDIADIVLQPYLQDYLLYDGDAPPAGSANAAPMSRATKTKQDDSAGENTSAAACDDAGKQQAKGTALTPTTSILLGGSSSGPSGSERGRTGSSSPAGHSPTPQQEQLEGGSTEGSLASNNTRSKMQMHYRSSANPTPPGAFAKAASTEGTAAAATRPHSSSQREASQCSSLLTTPPRVPLPAASSSVGPSTPPTLGDVHPAALAAQTTAVFPSLARPSLPTSTPPDNGSGPATTTTTAATVAGGSPASSGMDGGSGSLSRSLSLLRRPRRLEVDVSHTQNLQPVSNFYQPHSYSLHNTVNGSSVNLGSVPSPDVGAGQSNSTSINQRHGGGSMRGAGTSVDSLLSGKSSEWQFKRVISIGSDFPEEDLGLGATNGSGGSVFAAVGMDGRSMGSSGVLFHMDPDFAGQDSSSRPQSAGAGSQRLEHPLPMTYTNTLSRSATSGGGYRSPESEGSSQTRRVDVHDSAASLRAFSFGSRDGMQDTANTPSPPHSPPAQQQQQYVADVATVSAFAELIGEIRATLSEFTESDFEEMGLRFALPGLTSLDSPRVSSSLEESVARERSRTVPPHSAASGVGTSDGASPPPSSLPQQPPMLLPLFPGGEKVAVTPANFLSFFSLAQDRFHELELVLGHPLNQE